MRAAAAFQHHLPIPRQQERPWVLFCSQPGPLSPLCLPTHTDGLVPHCSVPPQSLAHPVAAQPSEPLRSVPSEDRHSRTHPCLINRIVKLRFYRDLAVGVGVHEGQAEAGVVPTPVGRGRVTGLQGLNPEPHPPHPSSSQHPRALPAPCPGCVAGKGHAEPALAVSPALCQPHLVR